MLYPLPQAFSARMRARLGPRADAYFAALEQPYLRGLRPNPLKPVCVPPDGLGGPIPWAPGRFLAPDSKAGLDPLHEAGAYYLQEPSAMAPVAVLNPQPGERVLDLCAAPGGKSTQIGAALGGLGLLVSNEPVPGRAKILSRNLERMGLPNALAVSAEPERLCTLWPDAFDAAVVDAPCSGEGMFRRHPEARAQWSEAAALGCAARQKRILACAARMLRPGGRLVYSTCTFNDAENERVVEGFLAEHPGFSPVPFALPMPGGQVLNAPLGMARLYPHEVPGEGHFVALMRREGDACTPPGGSGGLFLPAANRLAPPDPALLAAYAAFAAPFGPLPPANAQLGDTLVSAPELPPLRGIRVLRAGCSLGALKGRVFAPDHALAMALTPPYALPTLPLSRELALRYQAGEALPCPDALTGYVLPTYQGLALGFGKCSGGQMKNHYPKGLRRI